MVAVLLGAAVCAGLLTRGGHRPLGARDGPSVVVRAATAKDEGLPSRRTATHATTSALPAAQAAERRVAVPILMYHRVDVPRAGLPAITEQLTVSPAQFRRQMQWLHAHNFHAIRQRQLFEALFRGTSLPPKPVLITFDDGYSNVFRYALPVLRALHMPATVYVISSRIFGHDPNFLSRWQLRALEDGGVEIGSHCVTHRPLAELAADDAFRELTASRRTLGRALDHSVEWLAYPYGSYDASVITLARRAGYALAVTSDVGACQTTRDALALRRLQVLGSTTVSQFAQMLVSARCPTAA